VIYSSSGSSYIITNDHVVSGATTVKLQRWDSATRSYTPVVATKTWQEDAADDLAVIRIDQGNLPVATWGNSDNLQPGQSVVAIGYAENLGGGPTVTDGIVSSLLRTAPGDSSGRTYIGHSATINHGNSGGPLADMSGAIVGINTWTLDNTQGLFFAIPSTRAARVAAGFIGTNG
jgi:S1-C subfamily serine protease